MKEIEESIIKNATNGDQKAFRSLYNFYAPYLWRVLLRLFNDNQHTASDLLQEVFLKIHKVLPSFRMESAFSTWAYKIAYNMAMHEFSKNKHHEPLNDNLGSSSRSDEYENKELVQKILQQLSAQDRFLLISREIDDISFDDLSVITGQSAGTLRVKIHRIKENVKNICQSLK
jgi:RNA polymerase sigma-70 factor (ECF subfamily)